MIREIGYRLRGLVHRWRTPREALLQHLQTRCEHDPHVVTADILDRDFFGGPGGEQGVEWCSRCGSYRRVFGPWDRKARYAEWHVPHAVDTARWRMENP